MGVDRKLKFLSLRLDINISGEWFVEILVVEFEIEIILGNRAFGNLIEKDFVTVVFIRDFFKLEKQLKLGEFLKFNLNVDFILLIWVKVELNVILKKLWGDKIILIVIKRKSQFKLFFSLHVFWCVLPNLQLSFAPHQNHFDLQDNHVVHNKIRERVFH